VKHNASSSFWAAYHTLPESIRALADKSFALLKEDSAHPSVRLKPVGRYCSARVGLHYRLAFRWRAASSGSGSVHTASTSESFDAKRR